MNTNFGFRPAFKDEIARARSLFPGAPRNSIAPLHWFLAVIEEPIERIVGALWYRILPDADCIEFDLVGSQALPEASFIDLFEAWRNEIAPRTDLPQDLHLAGWHLPGAAGERKATTLGLLSQRGEKIRWTGVLEELEQSLSGAAADIHPRPRALTRADLGTLAAFLTDLRVFPRHELLEGLSSAAGPTPTLFDLKTSTAAFDDSRITAICLTNYHGNEGVVTALHATDPLAPSGVLQALLHPALRLLSGRGVTRLVFEPRVGKLLCPILALTPLPPLRQFAVAETRP